MYMIYYRHKKYLDENLLVEIHTLDLEKQKVIKNCLKW